MKIAILLVGACFFAVVVLQTHAEEEEDFDMSAVRLVRRVRRTYIAAIAWQTYSNIYSTTLRN